MVGGGVGGSGGRKSGWGRSGGGGGGRESPLPDSTMRWLQRRIAILNTFNLRNKLEFEETVKY